MSGRWLRAAVAGVLVVSLTGVAAAAVVAERLPQVIVSDPKDSKGSLDVRTVKLQSNGGLWFTVRTRKPWKTAKIWDHGNVFVFLDTIGDEKADYYALVRSDGRQLLGDLRRIQPNGKEKVLRSLVVTRRSGDGVTIKFPVKELKFGPPRTTYRWWALTAFAGDTVCRLVCFDQVPDHGAEEQPRPGFPPEPPAPPER